MNIFIFDFLGYGDFERPKNHLGVQKSIKERIFWIKVFFIKEAMRPVTSVTRGHS